VPSVPVDNCVSLMFDTCPVFHGVQGQTSIVQVPIVQGKINYKGTQKHYTCFQLEMDKDELKSTELNKTKLMNIKVTKVLK